MPYGGKEWTETVYKKPYRKQHSFRQEVLEAYDGMCAICGQNNSSLLRAAHIMDASHGGIEEIHNGICLCANHEIAFDQGILKIDIDGRIISLFNDLTIKSTFIKFPENKSKWPSVDLLKWKFNKASNISNP